MNVYYFFSSVLHIFPLSFYMHVVVVGLFFLIFCFFLFVCLRRRTYTHKLYGRHSIIIFFQHYTSLDCFSFHIVFRFLLFLPYLECQLPELLGWCGCAFGSSTSSFTSRQCFTFSWSQYGVCLCRMLMHIDEAIQKWKEISIYNVGLVHRRTVVVVIARHFHKRKLSYNIIPLCMCAPLHEWMVLDGCVSWMSFRVNDWLR